MKKAMYLSTLVIAGLCLALVSAPRARAAFVIGGANGWTLSTDGMVNLFAVDTNSDPRPANVDNGITLGNNTQSFRVRSGFLPGILGFNIKAPTINGLKMGARVGFYPNPQNANTKNSFSGQIDLREIYFTAAGRFGQVLVGKALSLFQGQNALTGMTLMGAGVNIPAGGGTTFGNIGFGYIYPQFNAQIRYTTPKVAGCKLAVAVYDPSVIAGSGQTASITNAPQWQGEASYATSFAKSGQVKAWVSGLYQTAKFTANSRSVTAAGGAGGILLGYAGAQAVLSGFDGQGLGSTLMLDTDSLDSAGNTRDSRGYLAQLTYSFPNALGTTKVGVAYGENQIDETSVERTARLAGGPAQLSEQSMWTFGVYHTLNPHLKLVAEYSKPKNKWFGDRTQNADVVSVGTFFIW